MTNPLFKDLRLQHPKFFQAVAADARTTLAYRAEPDNTQSKIRLVIDIVRLTWVSDAFLAQILYRAKARLQRFRVPILPTILHRLAMMHSQICIGFTRIGSDVVISPWVTVGLIAGNFQGPIISNGVHIGTGAKIIGPITIGEAAVIGANAVVVKDVPSHRTVIGIPAEELK
jgi:serine O-acetyltransferase